LADTISLPGVTRAGALLQACTMPAAYLCDGRHATASKLARRRAPARCRGALVAPGLPAALYIRRAPLTHMLRRHHWRKLRAAPPAATLRHLPPSLNAHTMDISTRASPTTLAHATPLPAAPLIPPFTAARHRNLGDTYLSTTATFHDFAAFIP